MLVTFKIKNIKPNPHREIAFKHFLDSPLKGGMHYLTKSCGEKKQSQKSYKASTYRYMF